ncbi:MAG: spore cortex biosynthesis protein YabQ [Bacteroidales bacterium]|nr:spore cortex biosynthesis protein YabQ [Clostridium sp.]MCM1203333.1 spore cortex biosynthesis protein YabQ [Bacteroidales bacterium]
MADLIYDEVKLFTVCLLLGLLLALAYDGIRILRLFFGHRNWLIDLEDLLFWLFTAWLVFRTLFIYNRGALRGYAFLGLFLGVLLYTLTLSRLLLAAAEKLVPGWNKLKRWIKKPFCIFRDFFRKALKNIMADVKMAIKGR